MEVGEQQHIFARPGSVPQIHQSEAAECGLVCLNMIGWAHGQKTDLASLRRRYSLSLKGLTLRSLMDIAGQMGFATRPVRFELEDVDQLKLDHVSGGLEEGADFYADPIAIPDGFTAENISGATLIQDMTTGEWSVELVFESDFTEAGYASSGDTPEDPGGRFHEIMPTGQSTWDPGPGIQMAGSGGQRGTTTTRVTTTKTSASGSITINLGFVTFTFSTGSTTTTTESSSTSAARITSQNKVGRLPSR